MFVKLQTSKPMNLFSPNLHPSCQLVWVKTYGRKKKVLKSLKINFYFGRKHYRPTYKFKIKNKLFQRLF